MAFSPHLHRLPMPTGTVGAGVCWAACRCLCGYGESPYVEHNAERAIVERMRQMHTDGLSAYIGLQVSCERKEIRTRYGKEFSGQAVTNILRRVVNSAPTQSRVTDQRAFADLNAGAFS